MILITVKTQVQNREIKPLSSLNICRPKSLYEHWIAQFWRFQFLNRTQVCSAQLVIFIKSGTDMNDLIFCSFFMWLTDFKKNPMVSWFQPAVGTCKPLSCLSSSGVKVIISKTEWEQLMSKHRLFIKWSKSCTWKQSKIGDLVTTSHWQPDF